MALLPVRSMAWAIPVSHSVQALGVSGTCSYTSLADCVACGRAHAAVLMRGVLLRQVGSLYITSCIPEIYFRTARSAPREDVKISLSFDEAILTCNR